MRDRSSILKGVLVLLLVLLIMDTRLAQQDPQFTQYMYNTLSVNPAYAGQRKVLNITGIYRTQWVGLDGAPKTQTLGIHTPLRNERIGLGLSVVNDELGPSSETYIDAAFSYSIPLGDYETELSFGVKAGMHLLDINWSKGRFQNPDGLFNENVNLFSPTVGAGLYLHSHSWYLGLSVPNIITTEHYDDFQESVGIERLHYFITGGYVFDLSNTTKFKPAFLVKAVSGAPLIADVSANFLFNEKLTLGLAWRWDDAISGLVGFQINESILIGYAYDSTTSGLSNYNKGTHEIMLRFEIQQLGRLLSPRFF